MADLSKHFYNTISAPCFYENLEIDKACEDELINARKIIRDHLREGIKAFSGTTAGGGKTITPKFYTQGSWAYKTVNNPCYKPPQQVDYDDGLYLPVSYLENVRPSVAAKVYFAVVDDLLKDLCKLRGWNFDGTKKTCSRVIISTTSHVDIPLYSIPDSEFNTLVEMADRKDKTSIVLDSAYEFSEEVWSQIASETVLLALRDGDWTPSDPRKIHLWFIKEVSEKGEQLRRTCRYLKAWRDNIWNRGGPSSILIMTLASELIVPSHSRDDIALHSILKRLFGRLETPVFNPADPSECLSDRFDSNTKGQFINSIKGFAEDLLTAMGGDVEISTGCGLIQKHLGDRFPIIKGTAEQKLESPSWNENQAAVLVPTVQGISYAKVQLKEMNVKPWRSI